MWPVWDHIYVTNHEERYRGWCRHDTKTCCGNVPFPSNRRWKYIISISDPFLCMRDRSVVSSFRVWTDAVRHTGTFSIMRQGSTGQSKHCIPMTIVDEYPIQDFKKFLFCTFRKSVLDCMSFVIYNNDHWCHQHNDFYWVILGSTFWINITFRLRDNEG